MKTKIILIGSLLVLFQVACSLSGAATGIPPTPQSGQTAIQVEPTSGPNPKPVSISEGLNSLNSYNMNVSFSSTGPQAGKASTTTIQRQRSNDNNASLTSTTVEATNPGEDQPKNSATSIYQIGNDQCSGNDTDGWSWTTTSPIEAEMRGLFINMIDLTPLIQNPVFVASETVNGISTNHFTFQVSGLGVSSGAVVNINQGDYWLAVDGNYIVKYTLIVETSTGADAQTIHEEISIDLTRVNQPVDISFPQGCLDAKQATPNP